MKSTLLRFAKITDKYYLQCLFLTEIYLQRNYAAIKMSKTGGILASNILIENTHIPLETTCSSKHVCTYTECAAALYTNKVYK